MYIHQLGLHVTCCRVVSCIIHYCNISLLDGQTRAYLIQMRCECELQSVCSNYPFSTRNNRCKVQGMGI
jgi:hypothetical protein